MMKTNRQHACVSYEKNWRRNEMGWFYFYSPASSAIRIYKRSRVWIGVCCPWIQFVHLGSKCVSINWTYCCSRCSFNGEGLNRVLTALETIRRWWIKFSSDFQSSLPLLHWVNEQSFRQLSLLKTHRTNGWYLAYINFRNHLTQNHLDLLKSAWN